MSGPWEQARRRLTDWFAGRARRPDFPLIFAGDTAPGPDFLVIGALGAGTGWLFDQLNLHRGFWMPPIEELHYFDLSIRTDQIAALLKRAQASLGAFNRQRLGAKLRPLGERDLEVLEALQWLKGRAIDFDYYAKLFSPKGNLLAGDVTPTYAILDEGLIAEVMGRFPKLKVVYLARDPVERFWAHYAMFCEERQWPPLADWYMVERFTATTDAVKHSQASESVARWRRAVPERQFGLFFFDDIVDDPTVSRASILTFLGADPQKSSGGLPAGYRRRQPEDELPISREARDLLGVTFADELRASAEILGGRAREWPKRHGF